ncbi:MAG: glycosyltransferase family 2 protein [Bacteriovoracaceae bacterium]|nr:glycosyltransferase family 2 protein [Bacteriovoracaceae bacterium]
MKTFGVLVPVYNEENTILKIMEKIESLEFIYEAIIVDDGSTDSSFEIIQKFKSNKIKFFKLESNMGKTAAINFALKQSTCDIVAIQDADLEYDPAELEELVRPIFNGLADVVYGSRFMVKKASRVLYFYHFLANKFLTCMSNFFTNYNMTDIETCYKVFRREILSEYSFTSKGFGMEVELSALFSFLNCRVYEAPISYYGRTYEEGKKVSYIDGVWAIYYILYFNLIAPKTKIFKSQKMKWLRNR